MYLELFTTFLKIGSFTFGGGFAMIPIIEREIVEKRGWLEENEFFDIISMAQSAPGPIAVNSATFVGYGIGGFPAALVSTIGTVLPSFIIIILIATAFSKITDSVMINKVFAGIRPAVVALIASTVFNLVYKSNFSHLSLIGALITTLILVITGVNPIFVIIGGVVVSIIYNKYVKKKIDNFHDIE